MSTLSPADNADNAKAGNNFKSPSLYFLPPYTSVPLNKIIFFVCFPYFNLLKSASTVENLAF